MKRKKFKEKVILAKLKERDDQAFIETYDIYAEKIYRFVYFKIGKEDEAEDLTSTIFLKTWNYIQKN